MTERVAVRLDDNNIVMDLIVAEADWAEARLGGRWVQCVRGQEGKTYPTFGAVYNEELDDFTNPTVTVPE